MFEIIYINKIKVKIRVFIYFLSSIFINFFINLEKLVIKQIMDPINSTYLKSELIKKDTIKEATPNKNKSHSIFSL